MHFEAPLISSAYTGSGQFINILAMDNWNHPLRRPMSIASASNGTVSIIYKIFGDVTEILSKKNPGEVVDLLGPLGNTFSNWDNGAYPVLVGGGVGLPPMLNLKSECESKNIDHTIIIGARNTKEHFMSHDPENNVILTTDDGSFGEPGNVMSPLNRIVTKTENPYIFACGPEPMLASIQIYALENDIPAQLSVESYMGCGVGLCQGCVISRNTENTLTHSYHEKYSLVCLDGPVYEVKDILFD
tara:strand:+ start:785 stop:1516 length:732 start_codon:yes stop_codon:yes gene_type:complete